MNCPYCGKIHRKCPAQCVESARSDYLFPKIAGQPAEDQLKIWESVKTYVAVHWKDKQGGL